MKGLSPRLAKEFEKVEQDVRHWYEIYAQEAMHACQILTKNLEGKIVLYGVSGSSILRGAIEQITDRSGCVRIIIRCIPKSGKGGIHEISPLQIIEFEKPSKFKGNNS